MVVHSSGRRGGGWWWVKLGRRERDCTVKRANHVTVRRARREVSARVVVELGW